MPTLWKRFALHCMRDTDSGLWPFHRRKRTVDRVDRERPGILPLHNHHRRADAVARRVELPTTWERIGGPAGLALELVDLLVHLCFVCDARSLQRLLDD